MSNELVMSGVWKGAMLGGFVAGVIDVGIYFVGSALGADFKIKVPEMMMGMTVLPPFQPMVNCLLAGLVSALVLGGLNRFAPAKAWSIYLCIAVVVFLGEGYAPFWAFSDPATIATLEVMHIPATIGVIGGIHRFGRRAG